SIGESFQLYADSVVVWGKIGAGIQEAHEIYAEGDVFLTMRGESFEADALYLDLLEGRGRLARATLRVGAGVPGERREGFDPREYGFGPLRLPLGSSARASFLARAA